MFLTMAAANWQFISGSASWETFWIRIREKNPDPGGKNRRKLARKSAKHLNLKKINLKPNFFFISQLILYLPIFHLQTLNNFFPAYFIIPVSRSAIQHMRIHITGLYRHICVLYIAQPIQIDWWMANIWNLEFESRN